MSSKYRSIRSRIMASSFITFGLFALVIAYFFVVVSLVLSSISSSYITNQELDVYLSLMEDTESSLEQYMNLRNYETIDSYYSNRAKLETRTLYLASHPSQDPLIQKEYVVARLTETFLGYADSAVYARRANNTEKSAAAYDQALKAYTWLQSAVADLNASYFKSNIARYNDLLRQFRSVTASSLALIGTVMFLNVLLLYLLVTNIMQPLEDISVTANRLAERDFDIPLFTYEKQDEIGSITRAFNRMIISIREYIDTIWEKAAAENKMQALVQDARFKALQNQINPHFLFNTINTGAQLAMMEEADRTCSFLEQVADFYRYNLQHTGKEATLQDEISLVDAYMYIMKTRFGDRFVFEKDIRITASDILLPAMTLQPLVENAIRHGLYGIEDGGRVQLTVGFDEEHEGLVAITVADNGVGFPAEVRERLLADADDGEQIPSVDAVMGEELRGSDGTGIGLANVISRLRMYYKNPELFSIEDAEGGGTRCIIRIPHV